MLLEARLIKIVACLAEIMQLRPWGSPGPQVIVSVQAEGAQRTALPSAADDSIAICLVDASSDKDMVAIQVTGVASLIARQVER